MVENIELSVQMEYENNVDTVCQNLNVYKITLTKHGELENDN